MLHNTGMKSIITSVEPSTPTVLRWARLAQGWRPAHGGGGGKKWGAGHWIQVEGCALVPMGPGINGRVSNGWAESWVRR